MDDYFGEKKPVKVLFILLFCGRGVGYYIYVVLSTEFPYNFAEGATLLVDKPIDWTSFDVVKKIRVIIKAKIGHAGTLDPLATGLMILCTGKFTKKLTDFQGLDKTYTGAFYLGATRPSFDRETEIDETFDISGLTEDAIRAATKPFIGDIDQMPPIYSAIKKDGKKLYTHARQGTEVVIEPRKVRIDQFEITKIELPLVYFSVKCSKGTYIRSLAHDFGKALNAGAHLHELRRTAVGDFSIDDAWQLNELVDYLNENKALFLRHEGVSKR